MDTTTATQEIVKYIRQNLSATRNKLKQQNNMNLLIKMYGESCPYGELADLIVPIAVQRAQGAIQESAMTRALNMMLQSQPAKKEEADHQDVQTVVASTIPVLYHGTLKSSIPSIMKEGLTAQEGIGRGYFGVYLSGTREGAEYWAKSHWIARTGKEPEEEGPITVLEVRIPAFAEGDLHADMEQADEGSDWQESLKVIGDCMFARDIPPSWIRLPSLKTASYESESKLINESKKTPEAKRKHKFEAAEWTFPNGHPRCQICGDEETVSGFCGGRKEAAMSKTAFVAHVPGHQNSKGEAAPWVVKQHDTGKILSSHKTQAEAKEHLRQMHIHKGSGWVNELLVTKKSVD